jgi:hypothetical protein
MYEVIGAERAHAARTQLGFTCELLNLAPSIDGVLAGGQKAGYKFALSDCKFNTPNGTVDRYAVNAVPINAELGKFAFCANEQGVLWYSKNGSVDECLKNKVPWPNDQQAFKD